MKRMQKSFILIVFSLFFLSACNKNSPSEEKIPPSENPSVEIENSSLNKEDSSSPEAAALETPSKKPSLPSSSNKTPEETLKELGINPETLPTPILTPADLEKLVSQQPNSKPDNQALEAMDPKSTKDCASYQADILKQICYNTPKL